MCAIRVSFPLEDDESTTGDGQFLKTVNGINCFEYTIDPPPHNRSYFESQIKAVSSYFDSVSYGAFKVDLYNDNNYAYGCLSTQNGTCMPHSFESHRVVIVRTSCL